MAAVLVAVLLGGNVLLGMSALVIDVGLIYVEREDLRSGAEAAALAVGKRCAANAALCEQADMTALAIKYAGWNAKDNEAGARVCGRVPDPAEPTKNLLNICPAPFGNLTDCVGPAPAEPRQYVEVHTSTLRDGGKTALPPAFSAAITGTKGPTIGACSRVSWGPVDGASLRPTIAMAYCVFARATSGGSVFQPPPLGPGQHQATTAAETAFHWDDASDTGCRADPADPRSEEYTDSFGWLRGGQFNHCSGEVSVGDWERLVSRQQTPDDCVAMLHRAYEDSTPIPVAIFNKARKNGPDPHPDNQDDEVRIAGIAAFVITGWWTRPGWENGPDKPHEAALHGRHLFGTEGCVADNMCIYGYFTSQLVTSGSGGGAGPDYGVHSLGVIG